MINSPRQEKDRLKRELADQIKRYQEQGGKIQEVPRGESRPVDMTNGWVEGFSINDNVGFGRRSPYKESNQ